MVSNDGAGNSLIMVTLYKFSYPYPTLNFFRKLQQMLSKF